MKLGIALSHFRNSAIIVKPNIKNQSIIKLDLFINNYIIYSNHRIIKLHSIKIFYQSQYNYTNLS